VAGGGADTFIQIPNTATNLAVGQDGSVSYDPAGGGARVTAGLRVDRPFRQRGGSAALLEQPLDGDRQLRRSAGLDAGRRLRSHHRGHARDVERDLATQFTNMIAAQRGFQANSRVISTGDEMLQELVNLKR
jgi:flagellar hook protein FlgE